MGMTGHLAQVDPAMVSQLEASPDLAQQLVMTESLRGLVGLGTDDLRGSVDQALRGCGPVGCLWIVIPGFLRRRLLDRWIGSLQVTPPALDDEPEDDAPEDDDLAPLAGVHGRLDLHKHWQLLHLYLTGSPDEVPGPAGDAILGGRPIGDDLGYGPLRVLDPPQVAAVAAFLADFGPDKFAERFDEVHVGEEVYGAEFVTESDALDEVQERGEQLRAFYEEAAREGRAVLCWIS